MMMMDMYGQLLYDDGGGWSYQSYEEGMKSKTFV